MSNKERVMVETVYIPDTTPDGILKSAKEIDQPFTAEALCAHMYKASWGHGAWVSGPLRPLVKAGKVKKVGQNKARQTLYEVAE